MNILVVAPRFHTNLYYRLLALKNAGNKVKVVVLYKGKSEYHKHFEVEQLQLSPLSYFLLRTIARFKKNYLKTSLELRLQWPGKGLKEKIKEFQPDVLLLKAYQEMLAIKTLLVARKLKVKVLMLTQTPYAHIKGSVLLFRWNIKWFKNLKVHAYITPIEENYRAFKQAGIKNIHYLPFVYPATESIVSIKQDEVIKILSVGKFVKRKEQLLLVKAVKALADKYSIKLTLIGEVADKEYLQLIEQYIAKNNMDNTVNIIKHLAYPDVQKEYKKHHLFVLPAYDEPAAYSIVEAMANGLPLIVSNECGTKCYIDEGRDGEIFGAKNLNDLIQKLEIFLIDRKKIGNYSVISITSAKLKHNPTQYFDKINEIIQSTYF